MRKIKSATFAKKIKTAKSVTPTKNVVSVLIESIFASVSIPVKSVCDSFPVKSVEFVKNSFPFNMISDFSYVLALNVFISEIGKETLNNKELKHGYLEPIKNETQPINLGIDDEPKMIQVGNTLTTSEKDALVALLTKFKEVFAWSYEDMPEIDTDIVRRSRKTVQCKIPESGQLSRMVSQCDPGTKEGWEGQNVCRFLRFK